MNFKTHLFLLIVLIISIRSFAQGDKNLLNTRKNWIPFTWESMKIGNWIFDKAAIIVPFKIDGIDADFTLQFDLGATSSMLYGNTINYFLERNSALKAKLDTANKRFMLQNQLSGGFATFGAHLGNVKCAFSDMAYFKGFGGKLTPDSIKTHKPIRIGTLGAAFFKEKVLIIDYPNQRLLVLDSLSAKAQGDFDFVGARLELGTLKIPFSIGGTAYWLMFDTGSSIFTIMTDEQHYKAFTGNTPVDSLEIKSWGKNKMVYGRQINKPVKLGNAVLPNNYIYMMKGNDWDDFYKQEKIIGITGNAYFLNNVVAIDFKRLKFGVYEYKGPVTFK